MECGSAMKQEIIDATNVPVCYQRPSRPDLPRNPNCGCTDKSPGCLWECRLPGLLETRLINRPKTCYKRPCPYKIPAVPCAFKKQKQELPCNSLCFDWTVDEPGPNDSYGLNGLNWYDWEMEEITKYAMQAPTKEYVPQHPGFSKVQAPTATPIYQCHLPIECYAKSPGFIKPSLFSTDVNYFRDVRCCSTKPPPAWKHAYAQWATNQKL